MTNDRPTIAIDIDDVLADSTESLRLLVNKRTGANLTSEHYKIDAEYGGYYERVWVEHGLNEKVSYRDLEKEMVVDVPPMSGVDFAIHELSKKFHVILVTARDKAWEGSTRAWLKMHFGHDDVGLYFCESHKNTKAMTKGQLCKELGAELLIDDNVDHCKSALHEGIQAVLFGNYGWHKDVPEGLVRCEDWPSILEYMSDK